MKKRKRRDSRPQALERALMAGGGGSMSMDGVAEEGRFGDTELAHVSPREAALLRALGGSGTRNPRSGLREYFEGDGGSEGGSVGADPGSPAADSPGGSSGGWGDAFEANAFGGPPAAPSNPNEGVAGFGPGDPENNPDREIGAPTTTDSEESFGGRLAGYLGLPTSFGGLKAQFDPRTQQGMFNALTAQVPGFGAMSTLGRSAVRGLGGAINSGLSSLGINGSAPAEDFSYGNPGRFGGDQFGGIDMGPEGFDRDALGGLVGATPVSNPATYSRQDPGGVPEEIASFFGPGMTDIQQRALISTYGTQGVNSGFRTDPVKKYYARLLNRGIIDEAGRPQAQPYTLPIEHQYWQGVLGKPASDPSKFDDIYSSISRYL